MRSRLFCVVVVVCRVCFVPCFQMTQYSLAYMDLTFATRANVTSASMVNREGQRVTPTTTAIRSGTQPLAH